MSVSGNTAAIAATTAGQIYIREYMGGAWVTTKVIGDFGTTSSDFVCLSGDHLAVRLQTKVQMYARNIGGTDNWGLEQEIIVVAGGVALDGNRLLLGNSGHTDVYEWNSGTNPWTYITSFGSLPPAALSGTTAVLALPDPTNQITSVYVYERNVSGQWLPSATVSPPTIVGHDYFGYAVALDGDWLIVGAPAWYSASVQGAAYVYNRNQGGANAWGYMQSLQAQGNPVEFGTSVSISGTRVAVGMEEGDSTVHVFERTGATYALKGRFRPSAAYSDSFGRVLGLTGDQLLASDLWRNVPNNYAGAVFSFDVTAGQPATITPESSIFTSPPEAIGDDFGRSVAMDGNTLAVGTPMADNPMSDCGAVNIYSRQSDGSWTLIETVVPADAGVQSHFGSSVALNGDTLAVTAPGSRAIYIFDRNTGGANQWGLIKELANYSSSDLSLNGDTLASADYGDAKVCVFERNAGGANAWGAVTFNGSNSYVTVNGNTMVASGSSSAASVWMRSALGATDWHSSPFFSTPYPFYYFGASSLDGDTIAISGQDSQNGLSRPKEIVSIRRKDQGGTNQWGEVARLYPFDRTAAIGYGTRVKLKGTMLVVGAPNDVTNGTSAGAVYVYQGSPDLTMWTLIRKISATSPLAGDLFGTSVDTNGNDIVGGAPGYSEVDTGAGAAFVTSDNSHFSEWVALNAPGVTGNPATDDPDGDGLNLFQEYAMGLSASAMDVGVTKIAGQGGGNWTFDYSLAKDAPDVVATVEWSTDLETWRAVGDGLSFSPALLSETATAWKYRATVPAGSLPGLFLRLRFTPR